jgi:hypothetical protein
VKVNPPLFEGQLPVPKSRFCRNYLAGLQFWKSTFLGRCETTGAGSVSLHQLTFTSGSVWAPGNGPGPKKSDGDHG